MKDLIIKLKKEIIKKDEVDIIIAVEPGKDEKLEYRFFESYNGSWKMLKDYSEDNTCQYNMKNEEKCFIMVQGRKINNDSAFDYVERIEYFKRDGKSYFKKVSLKGTRSSNNNELMNFQKIQKRNFEKFEEKMKQKSMEDMFDPLKNAYGADKESDDIKITEKPKLSIDTNDEVNNNEFKAIEIQPEEIETIHDEETFEEDEFQKDLFEDDLFEEDNKLEEDNESEEELQSDTYEIEIVNDTSIADLNENENISHGSLDIANENNENNENNEGNEDNEGNNYNSGDDIEIVASTSKNIDFFSEVKKDDAFEEELGFIPNYDYLVSEAETKNKEIQKEERLNNYNNMDSYKQNIYKRQIEEVKVDESEIDESRINVNKASETSEAKINDKEVDDIEIQEPKIEQPKIAEPKIGELKINGVETFHTSIKHNKIINGSKDIDIQKLINEKFVDKTLAQLDNNHDVIKNQINSMYSKPAITVLDESSEDMFAEIPKEELIKYILTSPRKNYYKGSPIVCTLLCSEPKEVFIKYELYLNEKLIAEKPYSMEKTYAFTPPYEGTYRLVFTGKKQGNNDEFKKEKEIFVAETLPVESVGISCDKSTITCNEPVTFMTTVVGGKNVVYEFYLFEDNQWKCVQEYSDISYFTLTPQNAGTYKLLIMAKNNDSQNDYDEFVMCKFDVKNQFSNMKGINSYNL